MLAGVGFWLSALAGWVLAATGIAIAAAVTYHAVRHRPRLTLTESGIAWSRHELAWAEIASMSEGSWSDGLVRFRYLRIETVGHAKRGRLDPQLFGTDFTIALLGTRAAR